VGRRPLEVAGDHLGARRAASISAAPTRMPAAR
jgi:hypothetical protein